MGVRNPHGWSRRSNGIRVSFARGSGFIVANLARAERIVGLKRPFPSREAPSVRASRRKYRRHARRNASPPERCWLGRPAMTGEMARPHVTADC
jgi:hypothetical protein